jgi:prepilin-type processing-associated H-X9-DG protein
MIEFTCSCGYRLWTDDADAGRTTRCPACGAARTIPGRDAVTQAAPSGGARGRVDDRNGPPGDARSLAQPRMSGKAVAALVLGLASLLCNAFTALPALLLGALAWRDVGRSDGRLWGKPLALAGMLVSALSLLCLAPAGGLLGYVGYRGYREAHTAAVEGERRARREQQSANNLYQIGVAVHTYEASYGCLPAAAAGRQPGQPRASWRVHLLPYLELQNIYNMYNFDEPWDGPNNSRLLTMMPKVYELPGDDKAPPGHTYYRALASPAGAVPSAVFCKDPSVRVRLTDIKDGTSNTIMIVEAAAPVPWTKPDDLDFTPAGPLPQLGWHHNNRCNALLADGSVRAIPSKVSPTTLRALITRDGGEVIGPDDL